MTDTVKLYEVLVPASFWVTKTKFSYEHHKEWDAFVVGIAGGLTVLKGAKGTWISPSNVAHYDRVIPCRVACTRAQLEEIIDFTLTHYDQEAVMAYVVSEEVIVKHKDT
jgi:hypothetical protein